MTRIREKLSPGEVAEMNIFIHFREGIFECTACTEYLIGGCDGEGLIGFEAVANCMAKNAEGMVVEGTIDYFIPGKKN